MPKKTYKIVRFDGGINDNTDPRDIGENQLAVLENAAVDEVGRIVPLGDVTTVEATFTGTIAITGGAGKGGRGFKVLTTDNDKFSETPDGASGAVTGGGNSRRYYIVEYASGLHIKDVSATSAEAETDFTASAPAEAELYFHKGALRVVDAAGGSTVSQWRGFIPGVLYGQDESSYPSLGNSMQGWIHNSGEAKLDQWYTKPMDIEGCFPTESLPGTIDMQVGVNLIMSHGRLFTGGLGSFNTNGHPFPGAAFANEYTATGTGPNNKPNDFGTNSGMYWGHSLNYHEYATGTGGWAPTGSETYQFYCTTVYDGLQESLPQMFTMYPSGPTYAAASGAAFNVDPAHGTMTYKNCDPVRFITLADGTTDADNFWTNGNVKGAGVKMLFNPAIKWHGLERAHDATGWEANGTSWAERNPSYNFGASDATQTSGGNPRITGIKVYWSSSDDGFVDLWQLYEWDFAKGVKAIGSDTGGGTFNRVDFTQLGPTGYKVGGVSGGNYTWPNDEAPFLYQHTHGRQNNGYGLDFHSPPRFLRYDAINGHSKDDIIKLDSFKTAAIANGRIYAGNVVIDGIRYADRIVKSGFCLDGATPDKFPVKANRVDVAVEDGDDIIKLVEFADRIFQFKTNSLYILNVSGGQVTVENKYIFKGIPNPGAVCETDFGIAWANKSGCYLHDGKDLINLLETKGMKVLKSTTTVGWEPFIGDGIYTRVGFNPFKRQIIVTNGADDEAAFLYDIVTKSWTYSTAMVIDGNGGSPFVNDPLNGTLLIASDADKKIYSWTSEPTSDPTITIVTKDIDFGEPAVDKTIKSVTVTYKGGTNTSIIPTYGTNGSAASSYGFTQTLTEGSGVTEILKLTPDDSDEAKNVKSIQLKFTGVAAKATFAFNDITIVYRQKSIK